jgi:HSP20 family molecular chaperone IbpA
MPRSGVDMMWPRTPTERAAAGLQQREVFLLTESGWEPPIDVFESETSLLVIVALPGVLSGEMEIVIGNGELAIRGVRRWPKLPQRTLVHRIELPHGRFDRRLPLPHGAYQLVGQDHADGCLALTLKRLV